jgi:3-oxoacyl-(acyl-carrier-protein) synthase
VVVTGVGILSGLGKDAKAAWNGVLNGLSAVRALGPDDKVAKLDVLPSRVSNALTTIHTSSWLLVPTKVRKLRHAVGTVIALCESSGDTFTIRPRMLLFTTDEVPA